MLNAGKQPFVFSKIKTSHDRFIKNVFEKASLTSYDYVFYEVKDVALPALDNNAPVWEKFDLNIN